MDERITNHASTGAAPERRAPILRILDAAANRAAEGLRVIEDYVRFVLDDPQLTASAKQLRHDLAAAMATVSWHQRLASRATTTDVGTRISTLSEGYRAELADVSHANFHRISEALRSIEEYGKILDPGLAAAVEQIRYQVYTLQKCVGVERQSNALLAHAWLYVLVDGRSSDRAFSDLIEALIQADISIIQIRDKQLTDRQLVSRARRLVELTRGTNTLAIVNDRPDIAAVVAADGVHVGQDELPVHAARSVVGPDRIIGVSTHSIQQVETAIRDGANYLGVGPVFPSRTKDFDSYPGLALVRDVAARTRLPWFAIGGITRDNLGAVLAAGAIRIAVRSGIVDAPSGLAPAAAAQELLAIMGYSAETNIDGPATNQK